ncbi:unnamed protein product [Owenia fusiformis]|uniref:Uncharacterized protein n=1 Tax=Owenia fusiformis TaxID=6347 RepID=A0A8J1Y7A8_OWEFU|nr:unnamed protein product [Owenia fusiformis]
MLQLVCTLTLVFAAVVMSADQTGESMKVHKRPGRGILECANAGADCWPGKRCCGTLYCHREKAYHVKGTCTACQSRNNRCSRDSQCCSGNCVKEGWFKVFGKCS